MYFILGHMLFNNQSLAAAAAVAAAGGAANGFNLQQQNSLGYGGGASSTLSSLGSPSIGSLSGKYFFSSVVIRLGFDFESFADYRFYKKN